MYSLKRAHEIVLYKPAYSMKTWLSRLIARYKRWRSPDKDVVKLSDVYSELALGQTLQNIRKKFPNVPRKKLLFARAFFAAVNPDAYQQASIRPLRILCDENVDNHHVVDNARRIFGYATHVSFVGLATEKDIDVWKYAVKNKIDLIVTRDCAMVRERKTIDLTACAHQSWQWRSNANPDFSHQHFSRMPRILHVKGVKLDGIKIAKHMSIHARQIVEIFEEATSPTIELYADKVKPGKHFLEFIEEGLFERQRRMRDEIVDDIIESIPFLKLDFLGEHKNSLNMLKRIVEHEMYEQERHKAFRKLSPQYQKNTITLNIIGDFYKEPKSSFDIILHDYKQRGIKSIFNNAVEEGGAAEADILTVVPLMKRLKHYKEGNRIPVAPEGHGFKVT